MRTYSLFNPIELYQREKLGIILYKNKDKPPGFKSNKKKPDPPKPPPAPAAPASIPA